MNTSALKSFAPAIRRQLIEAIGRKLDYVLTADTADLRAAASQVQNLRRQADSDRKALIDRVAYTWFNRFAALRFLDARSWHPFRAHIITPASPEETQPEILKLTRSGALPSELEPFTDTTRLDNILNGDLPSSDPQGEVYRHLVLAACRYYHALMPFLFESLDDETELLLPDDLLTEHSVLQDFRTEITDADCEEVEVLGWLYQFYISERKDEVMARKKAVPTEDIPAVTQLFTPHWIVRYLVENSLGRLWKNSRPNTRLKDHMPYYVEDPEGQAPTDSLTVERPEEIKVMDPACGSGHMLTYAFDLLYHIYEEEGHAPSEIPALILEHNLHGLEICPRATQLAQFALICKAREKSRSAFRRPVQPQVMCLQDVEITTEEMTSYLKVPGMKDLLTEDALKQIHQFKDMDTFGSLIQPVLSGVEIQKLRTELVENKAEVEQGDLLAPTAHRKVLFALDQAEMLSQRYHVVVANPPYMGSKGMHGQLSTWANTRFPNSKSDLFAMFIERNLELSQKCCFVAMITMQSWMFLSSYEKLREYFLNQITILSMAHLGARAFDSIGGEVVSTTAFVFFNRNQTSIKGSYLRLVDGKTEVEKEKSILFAIKNPDCDWTYFTPTNEFKKIPGSPIAYWAGEQTASVFERNVSLGDLIEMRKGLATSDNNRFIREWHEVNMDKIGFNYASREEAMKSKKRWFPLNKGGSFRKWYGNQENVINWENDGYEIRNFYDENGKLRSRPQNLEYSFKQALTWSKITSGNFSARYCAGGFLFDDAGAIGHSNDKNLLLKILPILSSKIGNYFLNIINCTLNFQIGDVSRIPISLDIEDIEHLIYQVNKCIEISKLDWDSYEDSWNFLYHPFLLQTYKDPAIKETYKNLRFQWEKLTEETRSIEEDNNRILIDTFGLFKEITPVVSLQEITLTSNPYYRYGDHKNEDELESLLLGDTLREFLSYAVGCMMGRYSLDKPGLILADAGDTLENYLAKLERPLDKLTFTPDEDAIIPILSGQWFEDDIVGRTREFLRVTFGEDTLEENIQFIEDALGKDLRKYFLTDFYKDHLQTYKKRPIYWLFQSPKKGFNTLIYMHRYNRDTVNNILNRYLREYLSKLRAHLEHLDHVIASESTSASDKTRARKESDQLQKTLRECEEWERDILLPLAQQRIEIDLDDGVKVNYPKFGDALAKVPGLS